MKLLKSHAAYTKKQRHGIFLLLAIIVTLQVLYLYIDSRTVAPYFTKAQLQAYEAEINALREDVIKDQYSKILPFNPNYINDYKGELLGMTPEEIDRLLAYRASSKWINSSEEFQKITQISDTLLQQIAPYFKFPKSTKIIEVQRNSKTLKDLNTATIQDLKAVRGIGNALSQRIINYRNTYKGGFADLIELQDIYGLTPQVITNIKRVFKIKNPRKLQKLNLNTATRDMLVTIKYIDYEVAHAIINYRTLHERFTSLEELSKVKGIPLSKLDLIKLSLQIQ